MRKSTPKATSVAMTHGGVYTSCLTGILCCSPIFCARRRSNSIPAMPQWREHARARLQTCERARGRKDTHAVIIHTGLGPLRLRGSSSFAIAPAQQDEPAAFSDAWGDGRGLSPECPPDGRHRDASILNALRPTFDHFLPTRLLLWPQRSCRVVPSTAGPVFPVALICSVPFSTVTVCCREDENRVVKTRSRVRRDGPSCPKESVGALRPLFAFYSMGLGSSKYDRPREVPTEW